MAKKTIRELAAAPTVQQPLCITFPQGETPFHLKTAAQIEKGPESIKALSRPRYFQPRPKDVTAERDKNTPEYSPIFLKGGMYQQEGINKVKVKDLKPKHIKDYLECKINQRNLNQPRKSAQAGPVVSCRDIPFVIQFKQIIEAPR
ncbi:hypothetical protein GQ457_09G024110 [Hibiscus cannabinus]